MAQKKYRCFCRKGGVRAPEQDKGTLLAHRCRDGHVYYVDTRVHVPVKAGVAFAEVDW